MKKIQIHKTNCDKIDKIINNFLNTYRKTTTKFIIFY